MKLCPAGQLKPGEIGIERDQPQPRRLRGGGQLVINFATIENLATAVEALKAAGADWDVLQLQAARSKPILDMHRMQAENPIWIVCAQRGLNQEKIDE